VIGCKEDDESMMKDGGVRDEEERTRVGFQRMKRREDISGM
jgi:hypothetical protein